MIYEISVLNRTFFLHFFGGYHFFCEKVLKIVDFFVKNAMLYVSVL